MNIGGNSPTYLELKLYFLMAKVIERISRLSPFLVFIVELTNNYLINQVILLTLKMIHLVSAPCHYQSLCQNPLRKNPKEK